MFVVTAWQAICLSHTHLRLYAGNASMVGAGVIMTKVFVVLASAGLCAPKCTQ